MTHQHLTARFNDLPTSNNLSLHSISMVILHWKWVPFKSQFQASLVISTSTHRLGLDTVFSSLLGHSLHLTTCHHVPRFKIILSWPPQSLTPTLVFYSSDDGFQIPMSKSGPKLQNRVPALEGGVFPVTWHLHLDAWDTVNVHHNKFFILPLTSTWPPPRSALFPRAPS